MSSRIPIYELIKYNSTFDIKTYKSNEERFKPLPANLKKDKRDSDDTVF